MPQMPDVLEGKGYRFSGTPATPKQNPTAITSPFPKPLKTPSPACDRTGRAPRLMPKTKRAHSDAYDPSIHLAKGAITRWYLRDFVAGRRPRD
jgi:hypothetical protein